jgi:hypothetical protein
MYFINKMGNILKLWKNNDELLLPNTNPSQNKFFLSDDIFNSVLNDNDQQISHLSHSSNTNNISGKNTTEYEINKMRSQIIILANGYNNLETKLNNIASQYELLIGKLQTNNSKINERMNTMTIDMESLLLNDKILAENVDNLKANFDKLLDVK